MQLEITQVIDFGSQETERVLMRVLKNCNLHFYILADTTYTDTTHISNKLRHIHWFPDMEAKEGDEIVLYTKKGKKSEVGLSNGKTRYTLYWGLDSSVWNDNGDGAILFELSTWKATKVKG